MKGIITTIQRMSIHDGPGIRSTVFLKGCNFRCCWCHNPETWSREPQLQQVSDKCISCGSCIEECQRNAISILNGKVTIDRSVCDNCGRCTNVCPSDALSIVGKYVDVTTVVDQLGRDKPYYDESGGGVTISGGEPFAQFQFAKELLSACKSMGIHTALETNLSCPTEQVAEVLPLVDLFMVDLKAANDTLHKQYTLMSNNQTIRNLKFLSEQGVKIVVRTPVVPNVNDNRHEIEALCQVLSGLSIQKYELLPFHTLGFDKFTQFGLVNPLSCVESLNMEKFNELQTIAEKYKS